MCLAPWNDYDKGMLRFQLNRLVSGKAQTSVREARRAPTDRPVRILIGERLKEGTLYSLAEGRASSTPRAQLWMAHT